MILSIPPFQVRYALKVQEMKEYGATWQAAERAAQNRMRWKSVVDVVVYAPYAK